MGSTETCCSRKGSAFDQYQFGEVEGVPQTATNVRSSQVVKERKKARKISACNGYELRQSHPSRIRGSRASSNI